MGVKKEVLTEIRTRHPKMPDTLCISVIYCLVVKDLAEQNKGSSCHRSV